MIKRYFEGTVLSMLTALGLFTVTIRPTGALAPTYIFGFALLLCAATLLITKTHVKLGNKFIWIPLAIIVISCLLSDCTIADRLIATMLFGIYLLGVNAADVRLLKPLTAVGCISIVIAGIVVGARTGGMYSINPNIAVGAIVMAGVLVKPKWIMLTVILVGLLFTGAEEALVVIAFVGLAMPIRRDWSRKMLVPAGICVLAVALLFTPIWSSLSPRMSGVASANPDAATNGRISGYKLAVSDISLFGHGYDPTDVSYATIHNVPLRILYEVGPVATAAWLWIIGYGLVKTRAKYLFISILALSLFDHFLWTQTATYMFFAFGASQSISNDYIFKEVQS
jgi:hypothetical protein